MHIDRLTVVFATALLSFSACSNGKVEPQPTPTPEQDPEPEESVLTIYAEADLAGLPALFENKFSQCSAAGVYILNEDETSYYNVSFASDGEGKYLQPESRALYFDSNSRVCACLPYVKDATKSLSRDVYFSGDVTSGDIADEIVFVATPSSPSGDEAVLDFYPVASLFDLIISNSYGRDLSVSSILLEFDTFVSGSFSCSIDADPSESSYTAEPRTGLAFNTISVTLDGKDAALPSGSSLDCPVVIAPTRPSSVKITVITSDGDKFIDNSAISGLGIGGSASAAIDLSKDTYYFDLDELLLSMNLFDENLEVPERFSSRIQTAEGVTNFRDLGGLELENGKTTASGILYRSASLDGVKQGGVNYMVGTLGIKTDLDLRNPNDISITSSPLGSSVNYFNYSSPWYVVGVDGIKEGDKRSNLLKDLQCMAKKRNYPMDFHCAVGRDRTGTLAFIVEALAGATQKALYEDYFISFYFIHDITVSTLRPSIVALHDFLSTYTSEDLSLSKNTENFLLDLGLQPVEISTIREILTTGDISVVDYNSPVASGNIESISQGSLE